MLFYVTPYQGKNNDQFTVFFTSCLLNSVLILQGEIKSRLQAFENLDCIDSTQSAKINYRY